MKSSFKKMLIIALPIFIGLVAFDIVSKYLANIYLGLGESVNFIPGFINFANVHNNGAAWNIFSGSQWLLVLVTFIFLILFSYIYYRERKNGGLFHVAVAFIYAGCIGNLFDRLFFGYVRDMIQFSFWPTFPVFNVADACLCIGVVLIIIFYIIFWVKESKKNKEGENGNLPDKK